MSNICDSNKSKIRIHLTKPGHRRTMSETHQINKILRKQDNVIDNTMKNFEHNRNIGPCQISNSSSNVSIPGDNGFNIIHEDVMSIDHLQSFDIDPDCQAALQTKLNDLEALNDRIKAENVNLKIELHKAMKRNLYTKSQEIELNSLRTEAEKLSALLWTLNRENQILRNVIREKCI